VWAKRVGFRTSASRVASEEKKDEGEEEKGQKERPGVKVGPPSKQRRPSISKTYNTFNKFGSAITGASPERGSGVARTASNGVSAGP
jgi:hypothetical protein